jgi:hypothetical protein
MQPENNPTSTTQANIDYGFSYDNQSSAEVLVERKQNKLICKMIYKVIIHLLVPIRAWPDDILAHR